MTSQDCFVPPPHVLVWLVNLFTPAEEAESILGDLLEEYSQVASTAGVGVARSWYWRQTVKTLVHLAGRAYRVAPLSTTVAVVGGFLLHGLVSGLPERAIFAVLHRYRVFDHHFRAYVFFATEGIAISHIIASLLVGCVVALAAKGREMIATVTLGLVLGVMAGVALAWVAMRWPMNETIVWMLWSYADVFAIVVGGAMVRLGRSAATALSSGR